MITGQCHRWGAGFFQMVCFVGLRARWEVPPWRLMHRPIRSTAANSRFDLVDGQFGMGLPSGNKGNVHRAWDRFAVFQAAGDEP